MVIKSKGSMLCSVPREDAEEDHGGAGDLLGERAGTVGQVPDGRSLVGLLKARHPLWAAGLPTLDSGYFFFKSPKTNSLV